MEDLATYRARIGTFHHPPGTRQVSHVDRYTPFTQRRIRDIDILPYRLMICALLFTVHLSLSALIICNQKVISNFSIDHFVPRETTFHCVTCDVINSNCDLVLSIYHATHDVHARALCLLGDDTLPVRVVTQRLLCSNDVETNPGPVTLEQVQENLLSAIENMKTDLATAKNDISSQISSLRKEIGDISSKCEHLEHSIADIREDIDVIKQNHDIVNDDIDALAEKVESVIENMSKVDTELDRLESYSRRDNIIIYGIPEAEGEEKSMACKQTALSTLNEHATFKTWGTSDVIRAHRLGVKRVNATRPRPMIVKLHMSDDKVRSLKARPAFKAAGLGISSDLTSRQRQQLHALKGTNMFGYFKDGQLVTVPRSNSRATAPTNLRGSGVRTQERKGQARSKSTLP